LINSAANKDEIITQLSAEIEALKEQNKKLTDKIIWFEEQIKLGRHRKFGKQSEQTQTILPLFDDSESDEVEETITPIDAQTEQVTYSRKKPEKKNGRNIDTTNLPREQIIHDLSDAEKTCVCGCQLAKIGEDKSEQLELIPEQIKVIEHITPKYTCRTCETIKAAKKPESPIQKCMAGASLIVDVIIKKYDHHLPLYRQSKILLQNSIDIPDNTLGNWVMGAADVLFPLEKAFWEQIIRTRYLQADETTVKVLKPDKKGYMWAYQSLDPSNRFILFEFNISRAGSVPENRLKDFSGILQTDGYAGYERLGKQEKIIHLGCWDHARRKFADAIKVSANKTGIANNFLMLINSLYDIEREIKESSDKIRFDSRQKKSKAILSRIFNLAKTTKTLPKSTLGGAITYLKNNEKCLRKYIEHGCAQISNILTENQIRPFAIGRKNWLFVGNEKSANKSALLYSIIQSCKINKIDFRKYLIYVLNHAHAMRRGEINPASLLPQFINPEILG
jgi:transposase